MNRIALLVLGGALLGGAVIELVTGCTSEAPKAEEDAGDSFGTSTSSSSSSGDDESSSSSGGSSSGGSSTSGSGSSSGGGDGGGTGDGGGQNNSAKSNPGKISCGKNGGGSPCDAGQSRCCWIELDASASACGVGPGGGQNDPCQGDNTFEFSCDEKADCEGTAKCCIGFGEATCEDDCVLGPQLCKTDAECGGETCAEKSCTRGAGQDAVVLKLRVCGTPEGCQ